MHANRQLEAGMLQAANLRRGADPWAVQGESVKRRNVLLVKVFVFLFLFFEQL